MAEEHVSARKENKGKNHTGFSLLGSQMLRRGPPSRQNKRYVVLLKKRKKEEKEEDKGSGEVELVGGSRQGGKNIKEIKEKKREIRREESARKIKREFIEEGGGL